jgi:hypothetical protein
MVNLYMVKIASRFKIIGTEVIFFGIFVLTLVALELRDANGDSVILNFAWVFIVIGITLILIGLELLSLIKQLPHQPQGTNPS